MADRERLRRALLFMPGDDLKKITKGAGLGVDSVILDLEDGVAMSNKARAREVVTGALTSGEIDFGRTERIVRLNAPSSGLPAAELAATFAGRPDSYMIPKVEAAQEIIEISERLTDLESRAGIPPGTTGLLAMVETARGIVNRIMRDLGPLNLIAPQFPLAAGAIAPLRTKAEAQGSGDFSPMWAGQAITLGREMPARELTAKLAADAQAILRRMAA